MVSRHRRPSSQPTEQRGHRSQRRYNEQESGGGKHGERRETWSPWQRAMRQCQIILRTFMRLLMGRSLRETQQVCAIARETAVHPAHTFRTREFCNHQSNICIFLPSKCKGAISKNDVEDKMPYILCASSNGGVLRLRGHCTVFFFFCLTYDSEALLVGCR